MSNGPSTENLWGSLDLPPEIVLGLLDNRYEGITIVDREGIIIFMSPSTERFFGLKGKEGIGKHVTDIFRRSNLHMVARTGKAEIGVTVEVRGQKKIVSRIPLLNKNRIIGAVSKIMFKDVDTMVRASVKNRHIGKATTDSCRYARQLECGYYTIDNIVGESPQTISLRKSVQMASQTSSTVVITGETGCGKEVVAQAIHNLSSRSSNPFVGVNCSAIPRDLFESELFGYAHGAFTGAARSGRMGMVRLADHGTLFLDEITELPLEMQPKLLRVLQERAVHPLGGSEKIGVDFRLICASNRDIEEMVNTGDLRQDLFFRLNVVDIHVLPLRERTEDVPDLSNYLLARLRMNMETDVKRISSEVIDIFRHYAWKGNVRELDNVLERAINVATGDTIEVEHLPRSLVASAESKRSSADAKSGLKKQKEQMERSSILDALERTRGNKTAAAKILGLHRTHLYKKMKKYGIA